MSDTGPAPDRGLPGDAGDDGTGTSPHGGAVRQTSEAGVLATRYGQVPSSQQRRRRTVAAAVIVGVLGLAAVVWLGTGRLAVPVEAVDVGFSIVDATAVDVTFDVVKDPEATVVCRVRALNPSFAEIGVRDVLVGPTPERVSRVTARVATTELATTGLVQWCEVTEP